MPNLFGFVSRLQRPNVFLPVHLYGQLVHDKTGCHLLEAQVKTSHLRFLFLAAHFLTFIHYYAEQCVVYIYQPSFLMSVFFCLL